MSLIRTTRRSGLTLLMLGLLGLAFFWLTDPRYGPNVRGGRAAYDPRAWIAVMRGDQSSPIDAANEASVASYVGLTGSLSVLGVGLYLMSRRKV